MYACTFYFHDDSNIVHIDVQANEFNLSQNYCKQRFSLWHSASV